MRTVKLPNLEPPAYIVHAAPERAPHASAFSNGKWWWRVPLAVARFLVSVVFNLIEAGRRWQRDDAGLLAGCVAYYATLSLFPLMIVLIAGLGVFLRFTNTGHNAESYVLAAIEQATTEAVAAQVTAVFQQVEHHALVTGPLAIGGLLVAAMAVFAQFDRALDKIWKIEQPLFDGYLSALWRVVVHRLKAFAVLLSLGVVVVLIFFAEMALDVVMAFSNARFEVPATFWRFANICVSILLNTIVFTAVYRLLSKVPVGWLHAARGGLLAASTWEIGRIVLAAFLISDNYSAYGVVGSLLAVMLWAYYASSVLFLGAEYVQVIREHNFRQSLADRIRHLERELNAEPPSNSVRQQPANVESFESWTESIPRRAA